MCSDRQPPVGTQAAASVWRRTLAWLSALDEAMDSNYDDVQDKRILALEHEVARLRGSIEGLSLPRQGPNAPDWRATAPDALQRREPARG